MGLSPRYEAVFRVGCIELARRLAVLPPHEQKRKAPQVVLARKVTQLAVGLGLLPVGCIKDRDTHDVAVLITFDEVVGPW